MRIVEIEIIFQFKGSLPQIHIVYNSNVFECSLLLRSPYSRSILSHTRHTLAHSVKNQQINLISGYKIIKIFTHTDTSYTTYSSACWSLILQFPHGNKFKSNKIKIKCRNIIPDTKHAILLMLNVVINTLFIRECEQPKITTFRLRVHFNVCFFFILL